MASAYVSHASCVGLLWTCALLTLNASSLSLLNRMLQTSWGEGWDGADALWLTDVVLWSAGRTQPADLLSVCLTACLTSFPPAPTTRTGDHVVVCARAHTLRVDRMGMESILAWGSCAAPQPAMGCLHVHAKHAQGVSL